jgi:hypothetical protein
MKNPAKPKGRKSWETGREAELRGSIFFRHLVANDSKNPKGIFTDRKNDIFTCFFIFLRFFLLFRCSLSRDGHS